MYTLRDDVAYFLMEDYELHECYSDFYYSFKEGLNYGED